MKKEPLSLPQHITVKNAQSVTKDLAQCVQAGALINVDVSGVNYCDSAGIAALLEGKKYAQQRQQALHYYNPQLQLKDLAVFLKVDGLLFGDDSGE